MTKSNRLALNSQAKRGAKTFRGRPKITEYHIQTERNSVTLWQEYNLLFWANEANERGEPHQDPQCQTKALMSVVEIVVEFQDCNNSAANGRQHRNNLKRRYK